MPDLLTAATLATWTQNDLADVEADPFATDLIDKMSELACFIGGNPNWSLDPGEDQAPFDVRMVVLNVCKRSYENPGRVIAEGSVGPIGGDRVADAQALFMDLTPAERATIAKYNPDGDPDAGAMAGELFTIATNRGDEMTLQQTSPLFVGDDQQINLATSPDPREWKIPMFSPGDPGGDENYVTG